MSEYSSPLSLMQSGSLGDCRHGDWWIVVSFPLSYRWEGYFTRQTWAGWGLWSRTDWLIIVFSPLSFRWGRWWAAVCRAKTLSWMGSVVQKLIKTGWDPAHTYISISPAECLGRNMNMFSASSSTQQTASSWGEHNSEMNGEWRRVLISQRWLTAGLGGNYRIIHICFINRLPGIVFVLWYM